MIQNGEWKVEPEKIPDLKKITFFLVTTQSSGYLEGALSCSLKAKDTI